MLALAAARILGFLSITKLENIGESFTRYDSLGFAEALENSSWWVSTPAKVESNLKT